MSRVGAAALPRGLLERAPLNVLKSGWCGCRIEPAFDLLPDRVRNLFLAVSRLDDGAAFRILRSDLQECFAQSRMEFQRLVLKAIDGLVAAPCCRPCKAHTRVDIEDEGQVGNDVANRNALKGM